MTESNRRLVLRAILLFLPLAVLATGLAGTIYLVAQHGLRAGADSPQLQLAEDAAHALDTGTPPATAAGAPSVDAATSLAPFVVVFDGQGHAIAESGLLDGAPPTPPAGVLDAARSDAPNRVTWQPREGLRFATVTVRWGGGTVMAARSLREVERLESQTLLLVAAGWATTIALVAAACLLVGWAAGRGWQARATGR